MRSLTIRMHSLLHHKNHSFQIVAIHGIGGCGKSQLALENVYRHLTEYHVVLWLHADSMAKLEGQLGQPGIELGLAREQKNVRRCYRKMLNWLSITGKTSTSIAMMLVRSRLTLDIQDSRWLIVFDSADVLDILPRFFARSPSGSVIVTSSDPLARGEGFAAKEIRLECFDEDEGTEFIFSFIDSSMFQDLSEKKSLVQLVNMFAGLLLG